MSNQGENFYVYLSQTDHNCGESKSPRVEKMLWTMAVLQLNLYIRIKAGDCKEGHMKSIGGRLKGQETATWGKSLQLDKK